MPQGFRKGKGHPSGVGRDIPKMQVGSLDAGIVWSYLRPLVWEGPPPWGLTVCIIPPGF